MTFLEQVAETVDRYAMLPSGCRTVVALSGGADSVSLLLALHMLRDKFQIALEAVHVNHCLRGAESDSDERFCQALCSRLGIPLTVHREDVAALAVRSRCSVEEAGRQLRYRIFESLDADRIATAHTADDNAETVLYHLARGTALKGLCGIPPVRGRIVRPLRYITRTAVEAYLQAEAQPFVTDSSNLSDQYTRNYIRHTLIPAMQQLQPELIQVMARNCQVLEEENAYLEQMVDTAFSEASSGDGFYGLQAYHPVIRKRLLMRLLQQKQLPYSFERLERLDALLQSGGSLSLSRTVTAVAQDGWFRLETKQDRNPVEPAVLRLGINQIYPDRICIAERFSGFPQEFHKNDLQYTFDCDKIKGIIVLRTRLPGDRIQLPGRNFTSSVKKLLQAKIPSERRHSLHYLSDEEGLLLVEGIGVASRVLPDEGTRSYMHLRFQETELNFMGLE